MEIKDNTGRYIRIGQWRPDAAFNATCDGPFAHILIGLGIFHLSGDVTARGTASKVRGRSPVISYARARARGTYC
jgi:hypothetical protein